MFMQDLMKLRNAHPELFDANANFDMEGRKFLIGTTVVHYW